MGVSAESVPANEVIDLRAGPLTMIFEPSTAFLRYLRTDRHEIVRGIYVAVRDPAWNTAPNVLSNITVTRGRRSFTLTFDVESRMDGIDLPWKGRITGNADGAVTYAMHGTARASFQTGRLGCCVLHSPAEVVGRPYRIETPTGSFVRGEFPRLVSPHDPLPAARKLVYQARPGLDVEISYDGDSFSTEDQRNWTDGSFKSFGCTVGPPYPAQLSRGQRVAQAVHVRLLGAPAASARPTRGRPEAVLSVGGDSSDALPALGLGTSSHGRAPTRIELERLAALNLDHLRFDLDPAAPAWPSRFDVAARTASDLGIPLEVALLVSDRTETELASVAGRLSAAGPRVCRWLVFHKSEDSTTAPWVRLARRLLAAVDPAAMFGGGSNIYFAHLNRGRPPVEAVDLVCFPITPEVHAADDLSMIETLQGIPAALETARDFGGGWPVAVTPVTLKPRFNPITVDDPPRPPPGALPANVDPRQPRLFAAAWTVGSLAALARGGAASATFYETTGWRGVMEEAAGSPAPFQSIPGDVFPVYHVFAAMADFARQSLTPLDSTAPLDAFGFRLNAHARARYLIANPTRGRRRVRLTDDTLPASVRVRRLNDSTVERAGREPAVFHASVGRTRHTEAGEFRITLGAHEVVQIDAASPRGE